VNVPISDLLEGNTKLHVLDTSFSPAQPILPRTGDANLDGFPDLLLITEGRVRLLLSTPCARGVPGCAAQDARRGWREMVKGVEPLAGITDARIAVFVDLDEDGTLDVMVQRTGEQGAGRVLFVQNNFYYDAFFMKAIRTQHFLYFPSLSSQSRLTCFASDGRSSERRVWLGLVPTRERQPSPLPCQFFSYHLLPRHKYSRVISAHTASTSGASYKYTILDTSGRRSAAQVPQLPQTSYQALNTPYAFFGLGRTNNYIENLFAGAAHGRIAALEMVIPNSKLVINPGAGEDEWHKELYLRPGQWIPWVGLTVVGTMVALAGVVLVLHLNEKVRFFFRLSVGDVAADSSLLSFFSLWLFLGVSGRTSWSGGAHRIISILTHYNDVYNFCSLVYCRRAIVCVQGV
jgi:integrin alpha FG-GAP repeat containing protein 1